VSENIHKLKGNDMENKIRDLKVEKDVDGEITRIYVVFGPHYFLDLMSDNNGELELNLGATHHGIKAHANEVAGELEKFIFEIYDKYSQNRID
jgi:hypothetical protein